MLGQRTGIKSTDFNLRRKMGNEHITQLSTPNLNRPCALVMIMSTMSIPCKLCPCPPCPCLPCPCPPYPYPPCPACSCPPCLCLCQHQMIADAIFAVLETHAIKNVTSLKHFSFVFVFSMSLSASLSLSLSFRAEALPVIFWLRCLSKV